ncbi:rhodanese-like domain-containing protein [Actinotalea sp. M2MS4P-6]|uniref:rhodanese-like domain-containing protein n=1 Tax=Actinotalea sp. M2MS4P-6 TaxID=2983762 RepID=UPI0021E3C726|nr:rhodanese-like domain-containing protein [Actinotalea sp. M2MS4P-6]MCV2394648.1 rhodanese-like domain-containing protein [Actinotalea sp. M2MS4P-6]
MREIDITGFAEVHAAGGYVLDVREPGEYVAGHVPGAVLVPMSQLGQRVAELPTDGRIHVICASGNRSLVVTDALQRAGYDAVSVAGGTNGWRMAGRSVVTGMDAR